MWYYFGHLGTLLWVCGLIGVFMVMFWIVIDFCLSLWTYKRLCDTILDIWGLYIEFVDSQELMCNVVDSHGFSFKFVNLQDSMRYGFRHLRTLLWVCGLTKASMVMLWSVLDFHLSLWTCKSLCGNVLDSQGLSFEFMDL